MRKNAAPKDIPAKLKHAATEIAPRYAGNFPLLEINPIMKFVHYK
jgi:hypothetical protein